MGVVICGDLLQLPPVDRNGTRQSVAKPLDDYGEVSLDEDDEENAEVVTADKKALAKEARRKRRKAGKAEGRRAGLAGGRGMT